MVARWKRRSDNAASWKEHPYQAAPTTPSDCKVVAMDGGGPVAFCSLAATVWYRCRFSGSWFSEVAPESRFRNYDVTKQTREQPSGVYSGGTVDEPRGPPI